MRLNLVGVLHFDKMYYLRFVQKNDTMNALNEMRNRLIAEGRYTDAFDELIIKTCNVRTKTFKIIYGVCVMEKSLFKQDGGRD